MNCRGRDEQSRRRQSRKERPLSSLLTLLTLLAPSASWRFEFLLSRLQSAQDALVLDARRARSAASALNTASPVQMQAKLTAWVAVNGSP